MRTTKPLLTLLLIGLFFAVCAEAANAQTLPSGIQSHLNRNYPGWTLSSVADDCFSRFKRAVVVGDFDGDRRRDYVVKIVQGQRGYFIALLSRKKDYEAHVLESMSIAEVQRTGLNISRRGEKYIVNYDDQIYGRLPNDAPLIGTCESHAWNRIYRNGRFN